MHARNGQHRFDAPQQVVKTLSRGGGHQTRLRFERRQPLACGRIDSVDLVEHDDARYLLGPFDVGEHVVDGVNLRERVGVRTVDHM